MRKKRSFITEFEVIKFLPFITERLKQGDVMTEIYAKLQEKGLSISYTSYHTFYASYIKPQIVNIPEDLLEKVMQDYFKARPEAKKLLDQQILDNLENKE